MGWAVHYQILRDGALTDEETAAIAALARAQEKVAWDGEGFPVAIARGARADRVLADGTTKLAQDSDSQDVARLAEAVRALVDAAPGCELRIADDLACLGWDRASGRVLDAAPTAPPLRVPGGELADPRALAPAAPPALDLAALDAAGLVAALARLDNEQRDLAKAIVARLDALPARDVATAILGRYSTVGRSFEVRGALGGALRRIDDPAAVAGAFLSAWRKGRGTYFYGDLPKPERFCDAIAPLPAVAAQMAADVAAAATAGDADLPWRRAEAALDLVGRDRSDRGLRALLELIRARRGRALAWREELYVFDTAHEKLATYGDARAAPTLLHYLGTMKKCARAHAAALHGLVRVAPERARPHVLALAARGTWNRLAAELLVALGGDDTTPHLVRLAGHFDKSARATAAKALRARGTEPPGEPPPVEEFVADPDREARHEALRALAGRRDRALFVSLVALHALDAALRERTQFPGLPFSWWDWKGVLPDEIITAPPAKQLAWARGAGKEMVGEQRLLPAAKEVFARGVAAVAATCPSELLAFDGDTLRALAAEEDGVFAALGG